MLAAVALILPFYVKFVIITIIFFLRTSAEKTRNRAIRYLPVKRALADTRLFRLFMLPLSLFGDIFRSDFVLGGFRVRSTGAFALPKRDFRALLNFVYLCAFFALRAYQELFFFFGKLKNAPHEKYYSGSATTDRTEPHNRTALYFVWPMTTGTRQPGVPSVQIARVTKILRRPHNG